ncbi:multidrug resistance-associated protein 1-like [Protopterus annectens]|uniref:multidrug resistance-associated protein 1-like n=1 Tax=Protopterus annectens TaxID=7888 RepID=UPI001CF9E80A|nr:multidrug resistance-associated protein 1-like [Protopterus annectens]
MDSFCSSDGSDPFWDWNRTWYTDSPDFTQCFQNTVLTWIPCVYLWLCSPVYFFYVEHHNKGYIRMTCLYKTKMVLGALLLVIFLSDCFFSAWEISQGFQRAPVYLVSPAIRGITMVLVGFIIHYERMKGVRNSGVLFIYWLLSFLCGAVIFQSMTRLLLAGAVSTGYFRCVTFYTYFTLVLVHLILSCSTEPAPLFAKLSPGSNPCPEPSASFGSKITFFWFTRLIIRGYKQFLKESDLWDLEEENSSEKIVSKIARKLKQDCMRNKQRVDAAKFQKWQDENTNLNNLEEGEILLKSQQNYNNNFPIVKVLWRVFGPYFLVGTFCLVVSDVFMFAIPQVLSLLLNFMKDSRVPVWQGYVYAVLIFLFACVQTLLVHQYMYMCFVVGIRLRAAITGLIYRKVLVLSNAARKVSPAGEIINLLSVDVQRLMDLVIYFNGIWLAPIQIALCFFFLWQNLGPSAITGIAAILLIFPLNGVIAKRRSKFQEEQMRHKDDRIKLTNEILSGIKLLKFYVWEKAFKEKLLGIRQMELHSLKKSQILFSLSLTSFHSSTFLIAFAMFAVYTLSSENNVLDAQKAFVSMALVNIMKTPLSFLPFSISTTMQAAVSLKRLATFLSHEELKEYNIDRINAFSEYSITVKNGTFSWSVTDPPSLKRINLAIPKGSLVAVIGHVGSGKSSLLSALLGEMEKLEGHVDIKGSLAYAPQQAWIQNTTFKDNITFGQEVKKGWYDQVVQACALLPDLESRPAGDDTEIGEKGVNLSGGEKQRVSLARALYRKSAVYLMDDPLSAVDNIVGQHIFENVIGPNGILKDKTRVLVTHSVKFLPFADMVIVMSDGEISDIGTYQDLLKKTGIFADLLHAFTEEEGQNVKKERRNSGLQILGTEEQPINQKMKRSAKQYQEVDEKNRENEERGALTEADKAQQGKVKLSVYLEYLRMMKLPVFLFILFLHVCQQVACFCRSYWLSLWADDPVISGRQQHADLRLGIYGFLGVAEGFAKFWSVLVVFLGGILASRHLHLQLLHNVLRSPMSFFEKTPIGNLLNRFSKEIDAIDSVIPDGLKSLLGFLFTLLEVYVVILVATPISAVIIVPLTVLYFLIQHVYVITSCQLRRLESVSRSPIYSHITETIHGASVIRAFGEQDSFIQQNDNKVDENQKASFPGVVANRWLAVNLEFLGSIIVLFAAIFAVSGKGSLSPGLVGFSISHALQVTGILSWIIRSWTDVENNIVSVERIQEYNDTPKEAPWTLNDSPISTTWPLEGKIKFEDYGLRYRTSLNWALEKITIVINSKEKIGIVGRTGAGKSSLTVGLFRLWEPSKGQILIDGVNIMDSGLHELRSKMTVIPQDPVLFSGSLRMNLDPFHRHSDEEIWKVLEMVHLKDFVSGLQDKLHYKCSEKGENLSVGQQQLLCLGRALLRKTRIVILDEATSAIDLETENLIQSTLRTQFEDCTVLKIAHRLNTIIDCERVIVLENGHIVECGSPSSLIAQKGVFYLMMKSSGIHV